MVSFGKATHRHLARTRVDDQLRHSLVAWWRTARYGRWRGSGCGAGSLPEVLAPDPVVADINAAVTVCIGCIPTGAGTKALPPDPVVADVDNPVLIEIRMHRVHGAPEAELHRAAGAGA